MTYPRSHLVDKQNGGIYHCWTRCVRRAWLVGEDPLTGVDHSHRSGWIEQRMLELADVFSVQLFGYAVMSNHYHLLLNVDPKAVAAWSDDDDEDLEVDLRDRDRLKKLQKPQPSA